MKSFGASRRTLLDGPTSLTSNGFSEKKKTAHGGIFAPGGVDQQSHGTIVVIERSQEGRREPALSTVLLEILALWRGRGSLEVEVEGVRTGLDFDFGFRVGSPTFGDAHAGGGLITGGPNEADLAFSEGDAFDIPASEESRVFSLGIGFSLAGFPLCGLEGDEQMFDRLAFDQDGSSHTSERGTIASSAADQGNHQHSTRQTQGDFGRTFHRTLTFANGIDRRRNGITRA